MVAIARLEPVARAATDAAPGRPDVSMQVDAHDRQQLEVRFVYGLGGLRELEVESEIYFFVPRNFALGPTTYPKQDFYGDLTTLMRLDAAPLPLERLADPDDPASPLSALKRGLDGLAKPGAPPPSVALPTFVRLHAHVLVEATRAELRAVREGWRPGERASYGSAEARIEAIDRSIDRIRRALTTFRRVADAYSPYADVTHAALGSAFRLADEYVSLFVEERLATLAAGLAEDPQVFDGSAAVAAAIERLTELARSEARHRQRHALLCFDDEKEGHGEYFVHRVSMLKKAVQQALYLDARKAQADTFVRNGVGAVGAALAAIWALAMQVPATVAQMSSSTQATFFAIAVLAYVAKDRIKAATNEYLVPKLRRFDYVTRIQTSALRAIGLGMLDAKVLEAMRFVPADAVPPRVRAVRGERRRHQALDFQEEVIHYRKKLEIDEGDQPEPLPTGYGVRDIVRFNVRHLLVRLDDPSDRVRYFDPERDAFAEAKVPRVYHLNLVLRVRLSMPDDKVEEQLMHARIVLNKQGIVRVEQGTTSR